MNIYYIVRCVYVFKNFNCMLLDDWILSDIRIVTRYYKNSKIIELDKCIKKIVNDIIKKVNELINIVNVIIDKVNVYIDNHFFLSFP